MKATMIANLVVGLSLIALALSSNAQENVVDLAYPSRAYIKDMPSILLAVNDISQNSVTKQAKAPAMKADIKDPWISGTKIHQYLGVSTLVSALLTALTHPINGCEHSCTADYTPPTNGPHANLGRATRALAEATVVSGLIVHWDDFALEDGFSDPDNLHVLLVGTGALLLINAVGKAPNNHHSEQAEVGALLMAFGVRMTW